MTTRADTEPRGWLFCLLGLLLTAAVYAPTLGAPFIWDDVLLIAESPRVRSLDVWATFSKPFWLGAFGNDATTIYFRPLTTLSYQVDYQLHGDNPAGYHLTNVAWHLAGAALLFALLRRRGASVALAFVLMLLWSLAPRLTEDVAWISGRTDVLCGVLVLLSLWLHRPGDVRRLAAASLAALGALFCKETGVVAVVALGLLELEAGRGPTARPVAWRWALLALPVVVYAAMRARAGAISMGEGYTLGPDRRALAVLEAVGRYAYLLVNPLQPRSLIGHLAAPQLPFVSGGIAVLVATIFAGWRWGRALSATTAYVSLVVLPLLMVVHLVALPVTVVASDRYLYLPIAGLLLAVVPASSRALDLHPRWLLAPLALVVALGARTASRVADYADATRFWLAAAEHSPTHPEALNSLGSIAYRAGLWDEAFALYSRAVPLGGGGGSVIALDNAALVAMMQGKRQLSARLGDELLRRKSDASYNLRRGTIAFNALQLDDAERFARRSLELNPEMQLTHELLQLIDRARAVAPSIASGRAGPQVALLRDVSALRYPEVVAELRRADAVQALGVGPIRQAVGFVIAKGRPDDARDALTRFAGVFAPGDAERLAAGVALRLQTANEAAPRLRAFLNARSR